MCIGTLETRLLLDEPNRVHYGHGSLITGHIVLRYQPPKRAKVNRSPEPTTPLFGPLQLDVLFQGTMKVCVNERSEAGMTFKNESVFLTSPLQIHNGPFHASLDESISFPFTVAVPAHLSPRVETRTRCRRDEDGVWHFTNATETFAGGKLPPSCETQFFARRLSEPGSVKVEYSLQAQVSMPGIDVNIDNADRVPVLYEGQRLIQAPLASTTYMCSRINILSRTPASTMTRPHGFKDKARALLRPSAPTTSVEFDLFCAQIPSELCLGQKLRCRVGIRASPADGRGEDTAGSTLSLPDVQLKSFTAQIVQRTSVQVPGKADGSERPNHVQVVQTLTPVAAALPALFIESERYAKTITTAEPLLAVPSSFSLNAVTRTYKLRLEMQIYCAGQIRTVRRDLPLIIHPPMMTETDAEDERVAQQAHFETMAFEHGDEPLPAYGDVMIEPSPPLDEFAIPLPRLAAVHA